MPASKAKPVKKKRNSNSINAYLLVEWHKKYGRR